LSHQSTNPSTPCGGFAGERLVSGPQNPLDDGAGITEQHNRLRHTPQDSPFTFSLAAARWKKDGEMFWRYAFVAGDERRTDAAAIGSRHRLKGGKEQLFKEVLHGLDLHHLPCESLTANRMCYAIAALADNLMATVKLLCLPDECQSWTVATLLRQRVRLPAGAGQPRAPARGAGGERGCPRLG
jgi:hypothetical protein